MTAERSTPEDGKNDGDFLQSPLTGDKVSLLHQERNACPNAASCGISLDTGSIDG